jgi:peptidoglycan/xylan/chitin deacetylase (PgdA/CDA1 family)
MVKVSPTTPIASKGSADAKSILATIHLDLDGGVHIYRVNGWRYKAPDDLLFETGLRQALDFFDRAKVRATLFVIAEDLGDPRKRELLSEAVRRGHDIASHSLTHRKLTTLNSDDKRREIFESRERLAQELGVEVRGFRAPGFDTDRESLELIDSAGYSYDSSLFPTPGVARRVGISNLCASPHYPLEDRQLVELPLPAHWPLPFPFHPCYSLVLGEWYFRAGLRRFRRTAAPLVLLFHLTDFADPLPENLLPNRMASLYTLSHINGERKRKRCEQMLELVNRQYELVETKTLLAWRPEMQSDSLKMVEQL